MDPTLHVTRAHGQRCVYGARGFGTVCARCVADVVSGHSLDDLGSHSRALHLATTRARFARALAVLVADPAAAPDVAREWGHALVASAVDALANGEEDAEVAALLQRAARDIARVASAGGASHEVLDAAVDRAVAHCAHIAGDAPRAPPPPPRGFGALDDPALDPAALDLAFALPQPPPPPRAAPTSFAGRPESQRSNSQSQGTAAPAAAFFSQGSADNHHPRLSLDGPGGVTSRAYRGSLPGLASPGLLAPSGLALSQPPAPPPPSLGRPSRSRACSPDASEIAGARLIHLLAELLRVDAGDRGFLLTAFARARGEGPTADPTTTRDLEGAARFGAPFFADDDGAGGLPRRYSDFDLENASPSPGASARAPPPLPLGVAVLLSALAGADPAASVVGGGYHSSGSNGASAGARRETRRRALDLARVCTFRRPPVSEGCSALALAIGAGCVDAAISLGCASDPEACEVALDVIREAASANKATGERSRDVAAALDDRIAAALDDRIALRDRSGASPLARLLCDALLAPRRSLRRSACECLGALAETGPARSHKGGDAGVARLARRGVVEHVFEAIRDALRDRGGGGGGGFTTGAVVLPVGGSRGDPRAHPGPRDDDPEAVVCAALECLARVARVAAISDPGAFSRRFAVGAAPVAFATRRAREDGDERCLAAGLAAIRAAVEDEDPGAAAFPPDAAEALAETLADAYVGEVESERVRRASMRRSRPSASAFSAYPYPHPPATYAAPAARRADARGALVALLGWEALAGPRGAEVKRRAFAAVATDLADELARYADDLLSEALMRRREAERGPESTRGVPGTECIGLAGGDPEEGPPSRDYSYYASSYPEDPPPVSLPAALRDALVSAFDADDLPEVARALASAEVPARFARAMKARAAAGPGSLSSSPRDPGGRIGDAFLAAAAAALGTALGERAEEDEDPRDDDREDPDGGGGRPGGETESETERTELELGGAGTRSSPTTPPGGGGGGGRSRGRSESGRSARARADLAAMLAREDALHPALDVAEEAPDPAAAAPGAFFHTFPGGASGGPAGSLTTFPMDDDLRDRTRTMASASGSLSDARSLSSTLWSFVGVVLAALGPRAIPRGLVASALALGEEEETFFCSEANGGGYYEAKAGGSASAGGGGRGPSARARRVRDARLACALAAARFGAAPGTPNAFSFSRGGAGDDDDPRDRRRAVFDRTPSSPRRREGQGPIEGVCAAIAASLEAGGTAGGPDATPDDAADAAVALVAWTALGRRRTAGRRRRRRDDDDDERDPDPFEEDDAAWAARVEARLLEGHARLFSARMFSARLVSARLFSPGFSDGAPLGGLSDAGEEAVRNARAAEARLAIVDFVASGTATARRHWAFLTASESSGAEARTGPRDVTLDDVYPDDVYPDDVYLNDPRDDPRDDFFRDDARVAANGPNAAVFVEALKRLAPGNASNASNPSSGESARTQWVPNHAGPGVLTSCGAASIGLAVSVACAATRFDAATREGPALDAIQSAFAPAGDVRAAPAAVRRAAPAAFRSAARAVALGAGDAALRVAACAAAFRARVASAEPSATASDASGAWFATSDFGNGFGNGFGNAARETCLACLRAGNAAGFAALAAVLAAALAEALALERAEITTRRAEEPRIEPGTEPGGGFDEHRSDLGRRAEKTPGGSKKPRSLNAPPSGPSRPRRFTDALAEMAVDIGDAAFAVLRAGLDAAPDLAGLAGLADARTPVKDSLLPVPASSSWDESARPAGVYADAPPSQRATAASASSPPPPAPALFSAALRVVALAAALDAPGVVSSPDRFDALVRVAAARGDPGDRARALEALGVVVREGDDEGVEASRDAAGAAEGRRERARRVAAARRVARDAWCSAETSREGDAAAACLGAALDAAAAEGCDADADADAPGASTSFPCWDPSWEEGLIEEWLSESPSSRPPRRREGARLGAASSLARVAPNAAVAACEGEAALGALVARAVAALAADDAEHRTSALACLRVAFSRRPDGSAAPASRALGKGALARTRAALASVRDRNGGGNRGGVVPRGDGRGCRRGAASFGAGSDDIVGVAIRFARRRDVCDGDAFGDALESLLRDADDAAGARNER